MAIGDSITDDCAYNGAWRQYLQPLLQTNAYAFTFIGRQSSAATRSFTETRHEGYCGSVLAPPGVMTTVVHGYAGTNVYLLKIIADALTNGPPDLVLVVMGANDIGRARNPFVVATNDMPQLLDLILSNAPNATIILTKTTTLRDAVSGYSTNASNVPIYNAALQEMVRERALAGQNISVADMFSAVDYSTMFNADHLHPNLVGLTAMAREFLTRIQLITSRTDSIATTLIPAGTQWKYSDAGQDLGTNWTQTGYNDSNWSSGAARLGYGDKVAATTLQFGPDPKQKNPTSYFRHWFVVPEGVEVTNLNFRLAVQDGAVVWLNGQELFRTNVPAGPVGYTNFALKRMVVDAPYIFYPRNLAPSLLRAGTNLLAVEVHLYSSVMPSMGFDAEVLATGRPYGPPQLAVASSGANLRLSWSAGEGAGYTLYSSPDPADPAGWKPESVSIVTNGQECVTPLSPAAGARFFRLQRPAQP